jgi:hypothetical protein
MGLELSASYLHDIVSMMMYRSRLIKFNLTFPAASAHSLHRSLLDSIGHIHHVSTGTHTLDGLS